VDSFTQINKSNDEPGEARQSGKRLSAAFASFLTGKARIVLISAGSSILAMILTSPPHLSQVSISILNTRFNHFAQVMAALRSTGVWSSSSDRGFPPLSRFAGVICLRCLLLGPNTPWKRVRLTRGLGTRETSHITNSGCRLVISTVG
jgi:hypothetical protein